MDVTSISDTLAIGHDALNVIVFRKQSDNLDIRNESGTARLEEAAAAYRDALKEWMRGRAPLDWAMMQNNLGTAFSRLGEWTHDRANPEEARKAVNAAFEVFMQAGQEHYRRYFEDCLCEIDGQLMVH